MENTLDYIFFEKFQSGEKPEMNNITIYFSQLIYMFKDEKMPLNGVFIIERLCVQ